MYQSYHSMKWPTVPARMFNRLLRGGVSPLPVLEGEFGEVILGAFAIERSSVQ